MNPAELAILGLLVEEPRHGYDLEKAIEERDMREWTEIGFSSIYAILSRLEGQGLVRHEIQASSGKGPPRKVFSVTDSGEKAWRQACLDLLATPDGGQLSFLLGLVALPALPKEAALRSLEQHGDHLRQRMVRVRERQREIGPGSPLFLQGMFEYSLALLRAEIEWTEDFTDRLKQDSERS